MMKRWFGVFALACVATPAAAQENGADAAARFGARQNMVDVSMSPDGRKVAYVTPGKGRGSMVYTVDLAEGTPRIATAADGEPLQISWCNWVSNTRLVCSLYAYQQGAGRILIGSRLVSVDADGSDLKLVSQRAGEAALYYSNYGGGVIDWLPRTENAVLMGHWSVPEAEIGSLIEKRDEGYGVQRVDTVSGRSTTVERAHSDAVEYISDGRGVVRIMGTRTRVGDGYSGTVMNYHYREPGSERWKTLGQYDVLTSDGFNPLAVDSEKNVVYGLRKKDGRQALYRISLGPGLGSELVYAHPEVDVASVVRVGRDRRVIGASYSTDKPHIHYIDKDIEAMAAALSRALPNLPQINVVDSSLDGNILLIWAGSDIDPGNYFVFDRNAKRLNKILLARPQLEGMKLAAMKPIRFKATDGVMVPGYLTLPPGSSGKNLPAIVLPHGGPEARDEWGFDWLAQFFASRGYAVLQPNFRGSTGYGDAWFQKNGFQSWRAAVGDVVDAGRWLISEGIADPAKLGIFGWSYGGYAALQSGVIAPDLYKAIVAVAPVTDFRMTFEESRDNVNRVIERERVGLGPHLREGSPAQNAGAIKAPVLLFHGDMDANVGVQQSRLMANQLKDAGKTYELVIFDGLHHGLDDSEARAAMLRKSDAFLRSAMKF